MNDFSFNTIIGIARGTPIWVWAILAYLIYIGLQALKPRMITLQRLIIMPLILIAAKFRMFSEPNAWIYFAFFIASGLVGYFVVRKADLKIYKNKKMILTPGSPLILLILVSIFVTRYYAGYLQATNPQEFLKYAPIDLGISGLLSGYFSGQRICYLYRYYNDTGPHVTDVSAPTPS
ncbi:MAG: hypothetical protein ACXVAX_04475 [Pseudobdellovibrio sp.]